MGERLRITECLRDYNRRNPKAKKSQLQLVEVLFQNDDSSFETKKVRLSNWNTGKSNFKLNVGHIITLCNELDCQPNDLISIK